MESTLMKVLLILAAALFYYLVFVKMKATRKNGGRAAGFKVGGSRLDIKAAMKEKETREERRKRGEVSLRDGSLWRRRHR